MNTALFILVSVAFSLIDVVLVTSLYHAKFPIKHYKKMIGAMLAFVLCFGLACQYLLQPIEEYRQLIQYIVLAAILVKFSKDKKSFLYMSLPLIIMALLDLSLYGVIGNIPAAMAGCFVIKFFLIFMIYEDRNYKLSFTLLPLSVKILLFLFAFLLLCYDNILAIAKFM